MTDDTLSVELTVIVFAVIVLPYKFVAFKLVNIIDDAVKDVPVAAIETRFLPEMVENAMFPLIEEPANDEIARVLPLSEEKTRDVNPFRVDAMSVEAVMVLPLNVEILNPLTFIVDAPILDNVIALLIIVEYNMVRIVIVDAKTEETTKELPCRVENTPAFA